MKYDDAKTIRVLHVVGSMKQGGIQSFLINLYRHVDRERVQFDFLIHMPCTDGFENEIRNLSGRVYYLQPPTIRNIIGYVTNVKCFLKEHQEYKIVHIHLRTVAAIWAKIARLNNRISVVHSHSTTNGYGLGGVIKNVLQYPARWNADYFMGCSIVANEWMFGKRIAHCDRCTVLNNGIEIDRFQFDLTERKQIRYSLGITDDVIVMGNVGRLVEQKNQLFLLDLMKCLIDKYSEQECKLVIIGEGPLHSKLMRRVDELKLQEFVLMLGRRADVNKLLSAFDVFLLPSKNEGFGIAAIEAQASGLPVLCSEAIPKEAIITDQCMQMPTNDLDSWCEGMLSIGKRLSDDVCKNRLDYNRKIREAGFDIEDISNRLTKYYMDLLYN